MTELEQIKSLDDIGLQAAAYRLIRQVNYSNQLLKAVENEIVTRETAAIQKQQEEQKAESVGEPVDGMAVH